ncbi:hypothetical protein PF010_g14204 [Phytophthora fragariae]|uniref:Uncharacterized protein n=2 Tax=Phytophthora TaxID=4783 RepID=A0A6A3JTG8_9STRA|nr:hypothetical protein PF003_g28300 [Phytophthora fragariae]KAE9035906.1 hypothetical protein PR002_g7331 [Phytophthora rubi]KAE8998610.1 hypothetical protein PF011_g14980 [Phytophthora fragariae]KAE9038494.1 hypothetical protein PR001_g7934 [Phytophthora rubi]KAE9102167.1 hypothetical protein PF010_g14204 [Phytophthora fragariae]
MTPAGISLDLFRDTTTLSNEVMMLEEPQSNNVDGYHSMVGRPTICISPVESGESSDYHVANRL